MPQSVSPDPGGPPPARGLPQVIGHRGSRRPGPENTATAVRGAFDAGAGAVEIDIRRAVTRADVTLVVSHDPPRADAAPLDEVLDAAVGRGRVICEIKNVPSQPDFDAPVCATVPLLLAALARREALHDLPDGPADDIVVSSFDWFTLDRVRELAGPATAFLTPAGVALRAAVAHAIEHGHSAVHPHWTAVTPKATARAHDAGLEVVAWTVGGSVRAAARTRALLRAGVDAVIVDDPRAVCAGLARTPV